MRQAGVVLFFFAAVLAPPRALGTQQSEPQKPEASTQQTTTEPISNIGAITPYLGLAIDEIVFPGEPADESTALITATQLKIGAPLTREALHDAMQALFATGRFADIQAEAERVPTAGVRLLFLTQPNYFIGQIFVEGVTTNPTPNQLATASRLQLGELYSRARLDRALSNLRRVLEENGFHKAELATSEQRDPQQHQVNLTIRVNPGPRASVGQIKLQGDPGYSLQDIVNGTGRFHAGDPVISSRLTRALQRIRTRYQKQSRLVAQVSVAGREYHPERNTVDYDFQIDRGPVVRIDTEGFKISRLRLRKLVPIYEEGAVDDDLINEGRRNIQNHLQTLGYFNAAVSVNQHTVEDGKELQVLYSIAPGDRHKLRTIRILGNQYFSDDLIRSRMQCQPAGRFFTHGRYSEALLQEDVRSLQDLYRSNGYLQAEVASKLINGHLGNLSELAVEITIKEGPQTRVAWVRIDGGFTLPSEQVLPLISTEEGQAFNELNLADDRDTILEKYFNNGFTNATVDVSYTPVEASADDLPRVGVTFSLQEGEQFFVDQVFLEGLHYTRPGVARREIHFRSDALQSGSPLSQQDMLEAQRRLYGLGLFNEVDTAIQNPEGTESRKNVIMSMHEAKRYTFDYGGGFEFQTGQPSVGTNQPLGQTGVSPRVSFGLTRTDFGGRHQTISMKTNVSRLQQRGLINFDAPQLLNRDLRFSATAFYDNTVDVSTFTSQRLEGTLQTVQILKKSADGSRDLTSIAYRFSYRRVQASNIEVSTNLLPLLSQPTRVGEPNFLYIRNRRDNDLETTHGNYTTIEGGVASSYFGSEADFSRLLIKNASYYTFARKGRTRQGFVFARSTSIGVENGFGNTVVLDPSQTTPNTPTSPNTPLPPGLTLIPLPERFFSGGGNSHRGFGLNQAGPRDNFTGFPVGGSALFLNNLELRFPNVTVPYLLENIGFTVFHDMGNVFARPQEMLTSIGRWHQPNQQFCFRENASSQGAKDNFQFCNYNYVSHAIGLGVRYQTPIGPLRFDFGYNLNPPAFPSFSNIVTNTVPKPPITTGTFGVQRAGHFNFSFSVGQSF